MKRTLPGQREWGGPERRFSKIFIQKGGGAGGGPAFLEIRAPGALVLRLLPFFSLHAAVMILSLEVATLKIFSGVAEEGRRANPL